MTSRSRKNRRITRRNTRPASEAVDAIRSCAPLDGDRRHDPRAALETPGNVHRLRDLVRLRAVWRCMQTSRRIRSRNWVSDPHCSAGRTPARNGGPALGASVGSSSANRAGLSKAHLLPDARRTGGGASRRTGSCRHARTARPGRPVTGDDRTSRRDAGLHRPAADRARPAGQPLPPVLVSRRPPEDPPAESAVRDQRLHRRAVARSVAAQANPGG